MPVSRNASRSGGCPVWIRAVVEREINRRRRTASQLDPPERFRRTEGLEQKRKRRCVYQRGDAEDYGHDGDHRAILTHAQVSCSTVRPATVARGTPRRFTEPHVYRRDELR